MFDLTLSFFSEILELDSESELFELDLLSELVEALLVDCDCNELAKLSETELAPSIALRGFTILEVVLAVTVSLFTATTNALPNDCTIVVVKKIIAKIRWTTLFCISNFLPVLMPLKLCYMIIFRYFDYVHQA